MYHWTLFFASAWLLSFSLAAQLCIHVIIEHYCCKSVSFLQSVLVMTQVTLASIEHSKPQKLNCWKRRKIISMHEHWFIRTNFSGASLHKHDQQSEPSHWSRARGCHRCLQVSTSVIQFCQNFVQNKFYILSQFPSFLIPRIFLRSFETGLREATIHPKVKRGDFWKGHREDVQEIVLSEKIYSYQTA